MGRFFFSSCDYEEGRASVRVDRFEIILSTLWRAMLISQLKLTNRTRHPELVIICSIQVEQRSYPSELNIEQHFSFCNPHAGTVFFQKVLELARR